MRNVLAAAGLGLAFIAATLPARADNYPFRRTLDSSLQVAGVAKLNFSGLNGDVVMKADSGNTVRINAVLRARSQSELDGTSVRTSRDGDALVVQDVCNSRRQFLFWSFADCDIDYQISYPRNLSVNVKNENGDVHVDNAGAPVTIADSNGDATVRNAGSTLDVSTKHGDVRASLVSNWRGTAITLHTSTGDVTLEVPSNFAATLQAKTRLGDVTDNAHLTGGRVTVIATTTLGDVRINRTH